MDLSKYGDGAAKLINKIAVTVHNPNSHVFSRLRELEAIAKGAESDELLGFVYYHYALAYYTRGRHKEILHYLKLAISYLVSQDDKEVLAAAYNIFAIVAKTNGCFEVALDYYLTAHSLVDDDKRSLSYILTGANIADLLAQMGDYTNANQFNRFSKQAIRMLEKDKDQAVNRANIALFHVNLGLTALNNNKHAEALNEEAKLEEIGREAIREMGETIELYYLIFKLRLLIEAREKKMMAGLLGELVEMIEKGSVISELTQEILAILDELIKLGELESANMLLNTLEKDTRMNSYARVLFAEKKINYYKAVSDKEKCMECYDEREHYLQEHIETQNFIYYESITLMEILEELRREEEKIRFDNIAMQKNAETDALTGIPNRYAMNRHLDYFFSEAKKNQVRLGIGIVDIDRFKKYNDTYGHISGDNCLIDVAKTIEEIAGKHGLVATRYGGDEFVLIYYDVDDDEIRAIEKEIMDAATVSVTHGYYNAVPDIEAKIYDYLAKADERLYINKKKRSV